jgi:hypothetical protein
MLPNRSDRCIDIESNDVLCPRSVMRSARIHQLAVQTARRLLVDNRDAGALHVALTTLAQLLDASDEPRALRRLEVDVVELGVECQEAIDVRVGNRLFEGGQEFAQTPEVGRLNLLGAEASGQTFEPQAGHIQLFEFVYAERRHLSAAMRIKRHEAFGSEHLERFTNGHRAGLEQHREVTQAQPRARLQLLIEDGSAKAFNDESLFGRVRGCDGVDGQTGSSLEKPRHDSQRGAGGN